VHQCEKLIDTIETDILFAIFGAQKRKILISQIKEVHVTRRGPPHIVSCRPLTGGHVSVAVGHQWLQGGTQLSHTRGRQLDHPVTGGHGH
jgi:hypothetical protein